MKVSSLFKNNLNKLFESYGILTEGVHSIRPQYQMISDNDFNSLLKMDPTYSGGDNLGKYTKWILNLYKKFVKDRKEEEKYKKSLEYKKSHPDAIINEPVYQSQDRIEDFQKIRDLLSEYEKYKKDIKQDVNKFNSIAELASAIRNAQNKDISVDERAKENYKIFREAMADGLKVVYNGPNFIIGVPTTYEASSHFKKPITDWCTAYPDMYNAYLNEFGGKYYIHLNKHTGELYQAHYESDQFKDASDYEIDKADFIEKYPELKDFYDKIWDMNNFEWWALHNKQPSEQEQIDAIEKDTTAFYYIKNPSKNVILHLLELDPSQIQYIYNPTEEMQLKAVENSGWVLKYIRNPSEEVQLAAVKNYGDAIKHINFPSEKIKIEAIKNDGRVIRLFEDPTEEMKLLAVKNSGDSIQYISNPSKEIQMTAINEYPSSIMYIKNPSEEIQLYAVNKKPSTINLIHNPSEKIQLAVLNNDNYKITNIFYDEFKNALEISNIHKNFEQRDHFYIKNPTEKVKNFAEEIKKKIKKEY